MPTQKTAESAPNTEILTQAQVKIDPRLGDRLDFDHATYAEHLRSVGLDDGDIAGTCLEFRPPSLAQWNTAGRYYAKDEGKGKIIVEVGSRSTEDEIHRRLIHETKHRIDDVKGERSLGWPLTQWMLGKLATRSAIFGTGVSMAGAENIFGQSYKFHIAAVACVAGRAVVNHLNPNERSARAAEKDRDKVQKFVTLRR